MKPAHIQPALHPALHTSPCTTSVPRQGPLPGGSNKGTSPLEIPRTSPNPCSNTVTTGEGSQPAPGSLPQGTVHELLAESGSNKINYQLFP